MIGDDNNADHCSEPKSTGKSHDRRAAPLEPQETIGRRSASTTCSAFLATVDALPIAQCGLFDTGSRAHGPRCSACALRSLVRGGSRA